MNNDITIFKYDNQIQQEYCEEKAQEYDRLGGILCDLGRQTISTMIQQGQILLSIKESLGHGRWQAWLGYKQYPYETCRRRCEIAEAAERIRQIAEFESASMVHRFLNLPEKLQGMILDCKAYTSSEDFDRASFKASIDDLLEDRRIPWHGKYTMALDTIEEECEGNNTLETVAKEVSTQVIEAIKQHLEDDSIAYEERYGDCIHVIQKAVENPYIRDDAIAILNEHKKEFASLADSEPEQVMVENGAKWKDRNPEIVPNENGNHRPVLVEGKESDICPCCFRDMNLSITYDELSLEGAPIAIFRRFPGEDTFWQAKQNAAKRGAVEATKARTIQDYERFING